MRHANGITGLRPFGLHHPSQPGRESLNVIGEVSADDLDVQVRATCGETGDFLNDVQLSAHPDSVKAGGLVGRCVAAGKPVASNDIAGDERVIRAAENLSRGHQSLAIVPLTQSERVAGVFAFYSSEAGFFDEDALRLLDVLAGNISLAVDAIEQASRLDYLAYHDALTGLPNRTRFLERRPREKRLRALSRARRHRRSVARERTSPGLPWTRSRSTARSSRR